MNEDRPLPVRSFSVEISHGGVGVTVCACGVLLIRSEIAWQHIDNCTAMADEAPDA